MSPRRASASPLEISQAWKAWLVAAEARAGAAMAGAAFDRLADVELADGARRVSAAAFPINDAPAQAMAMAFKVLSASFLHLQGPRRAQMAPALERLAIALGEILEEPVRRAFEHSLHVLGERE